METEQTQEQDEPTMIYKPIIRKHLKKEPTKNQIKNWNNRVDQVPEEVKVKNDEGKHFLTSTSKNCQMMTPWMNDVDHMLSS